MNRELEPAPVQQDESGNALTRFIRRHPRGFWFFFWGEFAERASFYGMKAILTMYLITRHGLSKDDASTHMSLFIAASYALCLVGGWIADNFLGKYWTIVGFSAPYVVGQLLIGIESPLFLYAALALLAMGSGVIKPNISTLMGLTYDQQKPGQEQLRSEAFAMYYAAVNVGSALSNLSMPALRDAFGYQVAFLFPAVLMVAALALFAAGKRHYAVEVITRKKLTPEEKLQRLQVLGQLIGLFVLVMFFWAIFDQHATTWIYFAKEYTDLQLFGRHVPPDQVQALNPILIVAFLPPITAFWAWLHNRGIRVRPTDKMIVGFVLTACATGIHVIAGYLAVSTGTKVSLWWQVVAYVVLTLAEILISVTGLELAFAAAPSSMKSFVTGCWLVTVAAGNLIINAPFSRMYPSKEAGFHFETPAGYFAMLTVVMLIVAVSFLFVARKFNQTDRPDVTEPEDETA